MKIVRVYTFEGPKEWLEMVLAKSLPDGDQGFFHGTNMKITVKTTQNDLPVVVKRDVAPVDLGYANGWGKQTPPLVKACEDLKHRTYSKHVGKCLTLYGCEICNYSYLIDSSD